MEDFTIHTGDARSIPLPDESVQVCVTSPPYYGLRDYGTGKWAGGDIGCDHKKETKHQSQGETSQRKGRSNTESQRNENFTSICGKCGAIRIDKQIGLEKTPSEYIESLLNIAREVRRVLKPDGTLWLNLGDSYNANGRIGHGTRIGYKQGTNRASAAGHDASRANDENLKAKDLIGIPWRVSFALQADGWYLRSDIIWEKPNQMPESVEDRPTKSHEYIFLLTKSERYFYDSNALKETCQSGPSDIKKMIESRDRINNRHAAANDPKLAGGNGKIARKRAVGSPNGRNCRSVWTITTCPYPGAHFATFPPEIPRRCILAGSRPGDLVLDPFNGSGTTGIVAREYGRRYFGVELNSAYVEQSNKRVAQSLLFKPDPLPIA